MVTELEDWADSVYYVGTFLPMVPTDAVVLGVQARSAVIDMTGFYYHKKNGVVRLAIS